MLTASKSLWKATSPFLPCMRTIILRLSLYSSCKNFSKKSPLIELSYQHLCIIIADSYQWTVQETTGRRPQLYLYLVSQTFTPPSKKIELACKATPKLWPLGCQLHWKINSYQQDSIYHKTHETALHDNDQGVPHSPSTSGDKHQDHLIQQFDCAMSQTQIADSYIQLNHILC